jgi:hypothetical protein
MIWVEHILAGIGFASVMFTFLLVIGVLIISDEDIALEIHASEHTVVTFDDNGEILPDDQLLGVWGNVQVYVRIPKEKE